MSWRNEETDEGQDIVYDGMEFGIAPSPIKGTANLQNVNIATQNGEVMASYARTAQQQAAITNGTLTPDGATNFTGPSTLKAGTWISVSASTVTDISTTTSPTTASINYLVVGGGGGGGGADDYSGWSAGGGGGGGEVIVDTASIAVGSHAITIGAGGSGNNPSFVPDSSNSGKPTVFGAIDTALGGGFGGSGRQTAGFNGGDGANGGGGGGVDISADAGAAGVGTPGNNGGAGNADGTGGGGGSTAGAGVAGTATNGGNGGGATANSLTGTSVNYGAGGGGGSGSGSAGQGVFNCSGSGGDNSNGSNATANRGGGGGGASNNNVGSPKTGGNGSSGIVVISYPMGSMVAVGGTMTIVGTNVVHTFTEDATFTVISVNQTNLYYVSYASGTTFKLSSKFDPTGANALTHGTTGSITFSTVAVPNSMVAKAVEKYTTATNVEHRYYLLDINSYLWVYDTQIYDTYGTQWMLPDPASYSSLRLTGLGVLNGLVLAVGKAFIVGKPNVDLGRTFLSLDGALLNEPFPTHNNFAMVGNQGKLYYCDGNYIGEVFATTSLITSIANIQSQCLYTASTTTGTISHIISGSLPYSPDGTRIPAIFYTDVYGTQPTNVNTYTVYYIEAEPTSGTFSVYSSLTSTTKIDIAAGEVGNQYFTTFWPYGATGANGATPTVQISTQRVNLPANETAQTMAEIGNTVLIGGKTNLIYPWNQIDATPSDFIALPENDVKVIVNVNNMGYIFTGNKGNVYVTNNSVASLALKVPDYCAGVPGTPLTYIEPTFTWGDADYIRGRVYFSILDQTATKAGNCGGIWSFIPSQNVDPGQEVGMALRLENQQSYGDYDGYATIILPTLKQTGTAPQYWAAWQDSYSTGTSSFGIDFTGTVPVTTFVVETDLIPTGTLLSKDTFTQLEYKLSTALQSGDSVQLYYRLDSTSAWTSCGTASVETDFSISGYYNMAFQKTQWLQFRAVMTTNGTTASSFCRLAQIILR
jgi:hypothetical protein